MFTTSHVYSDGVCVQTGSTDWVALAEHARGGALVWIDVDGSDGVAFAQVAHAFDLHHLAVEDAVNAHQRAKLDVYGDVLFVVMRPAAYDDASETVVFGELHMFSGPGYIITVRHGQGPRIPAVRDDMGNRPELLQHGSEPVLHAIIDRVVDDYAPVAAGSRTTSTRSRMRCFSMMASRAAHLSASTSSRARSSGSSGRSGRSTPCWPR